MRIYIVVTSFEPLKIYFFPEGLVRLATQPYTTGKSSLKKRFIHLTNFSIQKKADNYVKNGGQQGEDDDEMSSKWSME